MSKGQLQEPSTPFLNLLVFGIVAVFCLYIGVEYAVPLFAQAGVPEIDQVVDNFLGFYRALDGIAAATVLALYLASIISAIFIDVDARFFVIFFVLMIVSLVLIILFANIWSWFADVPLVQSTVTTYFPLTTLIFQNALLIGIGGIAMWGLGYYGKTFV